MKKKFVFIVVVLLSVIMWGCKEDVVDLSTFDKLSGSSTGKINDTTYIQLKPVWDYQGFNQPQAVMVGKEQFIYICDTGNNRIVMLNLAGQMLGTKSIKHPVAIAQDYKLNLLVCAQFDTTIENEPKTFSAVYKIDMVSAQHYINNASVTRILPSKVFRTDIEYTGISVFADNSYIVSRKGPKNTSLSDPDNSILIFGSKDYSSGSRLPSIEPEGTGLICANQISSLTALSKRNNVDFIATYTGATSFKTQWFHYNSNPENPGYQSMFSTSAKMLKVNRFLQPHGSCIDNSGNIFVADAAKDSVFKFNSSGDELESFGGAAVFNEPYGVAFFDKTLYVCDKNNNRILRFVLSTDL
jgi:hypothetical protein